MTSKVFYATKLFRGKIVALVCETLGLGHRGGHPINVAVFLHVEGVHHAVVVVSEGINLEDKGEDPFSVVRVYHAIVVVYESPDLGGKGKGENLVAVVVFVNSGSVQRSNTVSSSPETHIVVVVSCNVEDAKLLIQVSLWLNSSVRD